MAEQLTKQVATDKMRSGDGIMHIILDGLPPSGRMLLSFLMLVPLALSLSGILLQINVGDLIETALRNEMNAAEKALAEQKRLNNMLVARVTATISANDDRYAAIATANAAIADRLNQVSAHICKTTRAKKRPAFCEELFISLKNPLHAKELVKETQQ